VTSGYGFPEERRVNHLAFRLASFFLIAFAIVELLKIEIDLSGYYLLAFISVPVLRGIIIQVNQEKDEILRKALIGAYTVILSLVFGLIGLGISYSLSSMTGLFFRFTTQNYIEGVVTLFLGIALIIILQFRMNRIRKKVL
jgi:biotin transporter BioY